MKSKKRKNIEDIIIRVIGGLIMIIGLYIFIPLLIPILKLVLSAILVLIGFMLLTRKKTRWLFMRGGW